MANSVTALFAKRRAKWQAQNLKYLRYVFNDHFVLVLMFLIGFLAYQYADFLKTVPQHWVPGYLIAVICSAMVLLVGRLVTYIEPADQLFLLAKDHEVQVYLKACVRRSLIFPSVVIGVMTVVVSPLLGLPVLIILIWALFLMALKYFLLLRRAQTYVQNGLLQWQPLIRDEKRRQNAILKIFSQFTDVKGLQQQAKRRKYLDGILPKAETAYAYLFVRTFLRSGDYLMLSARLLGLALLSLMAVHSDLFAFLLVALFNYLLVFQLLPIVKSQDYQVLTQLYPLSQADKCTAATNLIRNIMCGVALLECLVSLVTFQDKWLSVGFVLMAILLGMLYPKLKLK